MPKRPSDHPTEAELEILSILWRNGPSTVRAIHDVVLTRRNTSLTTTLKTLQVMTQKALVLRSNDRPHRYATAFPEEKTQVGMLQDLLQKAFDGSASKLMVRLVNAKGVSPEELDDLAKVIRNARKKQRGAS